MRATSALLILVLASLTPTGLADVPLPCAPAADHFACVGVGTYSTEGGCDAANGHENGYVVVGIYSPSEHRYVRQVGVDNGCYRGEDGYGSYSGSYVGVNSDDGNAGDGFRRAHVNTGSNAWGEYCHAGIFNEQWQYTRLADCPSFVRVPVLLTLLP